MYLKSEIPTVSVIVTIYNAGKTITRCLESILNQTFTDFEVICVNDGSTDNSSDLLKHFADNDPRIKVFNQNNQGVASARQLGLNNCIGDYSIHVDSDDWIETDMLQGMLYMAQHENSDMVICDLLKEWPDRKEVISQKPRELDPAVILGQMFGELHGSLCNKLIRNSSIHQNAVAFENGLNSCEDQLFVMRLLAANIRVSYINKPYYHYIINPDQQSITQNWFRTPVSQRLLFIKNAEELVKTDEQLDSFKEYVARIAYDATICDKEFCPDFRQSFGKFWPLIKSSSIPLYRKIIIWLALSGIRIPRN